MILFCSVVAIIFDILPNLDELIATLSNSIFLVNTKKLTSIIFTLFCDISKFVRVRKNKVIFNFLGDIPGRLQRRLNEINGLSLILERYTVVIERAKGFW